MSQAIDRCSAQLACVQDTRAPGGRSAAAGHHMGAEDAAGGDDEEHVADCEGGPCRGFKEKLLDRAPDCHLERARSGCVERGLW